MFEYYAEGGEQREYDQYSRWECKLDAVYTFHDTEHEQTTNINCLFSRIILNDMDLIKANGMSVACGGTDQPEAVDNDDKLGDNNEGLGGDDSNDAGGNNDNGAGIVRSAAGDGGVNEDEDNNKSTAGADDVVNGFAGGAGNSNIDQDGTGDNVPPPSEREDMSRKRQKSDCAVTRRQLALREKILDMRFSLTSDGMPSMLEQSFGPLVDVHFATYFHKKDKKHKAIRYKKQRLNVPPKAASENNDEGWSTAPEAFSTSSSSSSIETIGATAAATDGIGDGGEPKEQEKPLDVEQCRRDTLQQLLNFDFGFCPTRDAALVAKNANKYFTNDKVMHKYWFQRFRFFSKLEEDILMDREGWFSVTPERVAHHVADRMVMLPDCTILDAFAGVGGNAIQFALRGAYVIAVDIDPVKLRCALQNARVYGVADRISFICGSVFHVVASMFGALDAKEERRRRRTQRHSNTDDEDDDNNNMTLMGYPHGIDAVFLSPPWGGPAYLKMGHSFDLLTDMEPNGVHIFRVVQQISPNIVYFLPKNTRTDQLIALAGPNGRVELEQAQLNKKIKALHAYYGIFIPNF